MAAHLRKSYSEDNLPAAPWRFPLYFIPFLVLLYSLARCEFHPKVTIACNGFCLLRHTKTWLARDIISYSGTMFSRVLYYMAVAIDTNLLVALRATDLLSTPIQSRDHILTT